MVPSINVNQITARADDLYLYIVDGVSVCPSQNSQDRPERAFEGLVWRRLLLKVGTNQGPAWRAGAGVKKVCTALTVGIGQIIFCRTN